MRRFRFRLQRVMEIRERLRDMQKLELARRASEYGLELAKMEKLKKEKSLAISKMKASTSLEERQLIDEYIVSNEMMQRYKLKDIEEKEKPFREALGKYLKRDKDVKVLEKLRDRAFGEFIRLSMKEEETAVDDSVSSSWCKKIVGGEGSE